jgi:hypothetical protein
MLKDMGILVGLLFALLLTGCQNDRDFTAAQPTIPANAATLNLATNAYVFSSEGYVRFSHASHNKHPEINNNCMICHRHTAITVSPSWPCAKCHGPGGIAAGLEVCTNEIPEHGQSCVTWACLNCHSARPQDPDQYGNTPTDCHYCHAYKATFADSPVNGLPYSSGGWSSKTSSDNDFVSDYDHGIFEYHPGDTLTFSVGGVNLGSLDVYALLQVAGRSYITPIDLVPGAGSEADPVANPTVTNISRFLQSLNVNPDPLSNIIILPEDLGKYIANGRLKVNFAVDPVDFGNDPGLQNILSHYGKPLVSAADAQAHLQTTINTM